MSTEAMKWAIEQAPPMPAQLVATLAGLANHADAKGRGAYPSLAKLAAYTCKAERSVRRDLRQLEELGLIRRGDPRRVAHLPSDRRPEVYDLAVERTVPGGRAGDDEGTQASARTLASARSRGGKKKPSSDAYRPDVHVRGDADVRADVDVTNGGTWTSQRGDAHVTTGGTPTSAKPSVEPSENHPMKRGNAPWPSAPVTDDRIAPIDADGFELSDFMRRWALSTFGTTLDVDYETAQFVSHHRAEGTRRRSWPDEWQKWMRRSAKYAAERTTRRASGDHQQASDDLFDRAMARAAARDAQENQ
ncbi:helix-turn-helix domain-containing protein [Streptomyces sp. NPDC059340]|uniref:helix-turn-helix domain-containing protein n=1 Tax=Streptomyces sp. NPDC059340 TaxID=3346806 RepID=UPI0036A66ACB